MLDKFYCIFVQMPYDAETAEEHKLIRSYCKNLLYKNREGEKCAHEACLLPSWKQKMSYHAEKPNVVKWQN